MSKVIRLDDETLKHIEIIRQALLEDEFYKVRLVGGITDKEVVKLCILKCSFEFDKLF